MQYLSTRGGPAVVLEDAIMAGTAPDGGLYVPDQLPTIDLSTIPVDAPINEVAYQIGRAHV